MSDTPTSDDERLPPGVPRRRDRRDAPVAVGASRPADAYPTVDVLDEPRADDDEWRWDDGRYVRVTQPVGRVRRVLYVLIGLGLVVALALFGLVSWVRGQMDPPGPPGAVVTIDVPAGSTTDSIATLLGDEDVIRNTTVFRYYLRWKRLGGFEAGLYSMRENMSFDDAIAVLEAGPAPARFERFTVPEGLTVAETAEILEGQIESFSASDMQSALIRLESGWKPPEETSWEGILFPDTYEYELTDEPMQILARMNRQFDIVAREVGLDPWMNLDPAAATGYGAYQYIIIASMIETESRIPEEFGRVSRVIHNRLEQGMTLGIDATTLYARELVRPGATGPLTDADLAIDSPYNTRLNPGLPPTPIASPGRAALAAALNPEPGPWLYYVLASEDGSHFFTDDYDEFIRVRDESRAAGLF